MTALQEGGGGARRGVRYALCSWGLVIGMAQIHKL